MRRFVIGTILLATIAAIAAVVTYGVTRRNELSWQLDTHRIGAVETYDEAAGIIHELDTPPAHEDKLRALTTKWGTGNEQFDERLVRYVLSPAATESMRAEFSHELSWREDLLDLWGKHWQAHAERPLPEELASLQAYLATLATSGRALSWRDVLDMQAWLTLTGESRLAVRLTPENWVERFQAWQERAASRGSEATPAADTTDGSTEVPPDATPPFVAPASTISPDTLPPDVVPLPRAE